MMNDLIDVNTVRKKRNRLAITTYTTEGVGEEKGRVRETFGEIR